MSSQNDLSNRSIDDLLNTANEMALTHPRTISVEKGLGEIVGLLENRPPPAFIEYLLRQFPKCQSEVILIMLLVAIQESLYVPQIDFVLRAYSELVRRSGDVNADAQKYDEWLLAARTDMCVGWREEHLEEVAKLAGDPRITISALTMIDMWQCVTGKLTDSVKALVATKLAPDGDAALLAQEILKYASKQKSR